MSKKKAVVAGPSGTARGIGDVVTARERLVVSLVESGMGYREVAQSLGLTSVSGLRTSVCKARRKLRVAEKVYQVSCDRMDQELVPMAVDGMLKMVEAGVPEAIYRTLEGRGVLRPRGGTGTEGAGHGGTPTLNISFTQVAGTPTVAVGGIVGSPRGEPRRIEERAVVGELVAIEGSVPRGTGGM